MLKIKEENVIIKNIKEKYKLRGKIYGKIIQEIN
jgi:hypothetical protein